MDGPKLVTELQHACGFFELSASSDYCVHADGNSTSVILWAAQNEVSANLTL